MVTSLAVNNGILFAGTDRNSVWCQPIEDAVKTLHAKPAQNVPLPDDFSVTKSGHTSLVNVSLSRPQLVDVRIIDLAGKMVAHPAHARYNAGTHRFILNNTDMRAGCYLLRIQIGGEVVTRKVLVMR